MQLSFFQCRLTRARYLELTERLDATLSSTDDHVMLVDVGPADSVKPRIQSLGKTGFTPIERTPIIV